MGKGRLIILAAIALIGVGLTMLAGTFIQRPANQTVVQPTEVQDQKSSNTSDPQFWPLMVPVGPDGNAVKPKSENSGALRMIPGLTKQASIIQPAVYRKAQEKAQIILARGPVRLGSAGPGWHNIGRPTGSGSSYGASPHGGKAQSGGGSISVWGGDGSFDYSDDMGKIHFNGPDDGGASTGYIEDKDGNRTTFEYGDDGSRSYWGPDGSIRVDGPDGSTATYNRDGSITTTSPDGETTIDLDFPPLPPPPPGPKGGGQGIGEPHFLTFDGVGFSTQAVGEFVLAQGVDGQELQIRTSPYKKSKSVSAISGLSMRAGGAVIQILLDGSVLVDGGPAPGDGAALRHELPDGGAIGIWRVDNELAHVVVIWPDLSTLWVTRRDGFLDFAVQWRNQEKSRQGLLGQEDSDPGNDLTIRDGGTVEAGDSEGVKRFVDSWRVSDEGSLFSYSADEGTETFTDRSFPYDEPDIQHQELAEKLCVDIEPEFLQRACQFDVAVTGVEDFAESAKAAAAAALRGQAEKPKATVQPVVSGECATAQDDTSKAEALAGDSLEITSDTDTTRLFELETTRGIVIQTKIQTAHSGDYTPGLAAYCVFDQAGKTVIPLTNAGTDSFFSRDDSVNIPKGKYYLKLTGVGETRLSIILNHPEADQ